MRNHENKIQIYKEDVRYANVQYQSINIDIQYQCNLIN